MYIHPARLYDYQTIYDNLQLEIANKNVSVSKMGDLELYHYTNKCTYDHAWNVWTKMARGLILDVVEKRVVATPFEKFFNYGELGNFDLPNEPFSAFEKLDGSMIICFWYKDRWILTTKGSFYSEQGKWATEKFKEYDEEALVKGTTYIFEAIYKANQIVVSYNYEGLVILSCFSENGTETGYNHLPALSHIIECKDAISYSFNNIEEIINAAKILDKNNEGFVVRFENGYRIKIKGEEYKRIHKIVSNITPIAIWEAMLAKDNLLEIRKQIPEEFYKDFDKIRDLLSEKMQDLLMEIGIWGLKTKDLSNKELGLDESVPKDIKGFIFAARNNKSIITDKKQRESFFRKFRPDGNILEGYSASTHLLGLKDEI
jgi:RNA ligase